MRYYLTDGKTWYKLKKFVRENRKDQTFAESALWSKLRHNQLGCRFRRQHVVSDYIVDFICIEKKLIIEVDGESHKEQIEYDAERDRILTAMGYDILRVTNEEVTEMIDIVIKKILERFDNTPF